jgi:hypothetical protein
MMRRKLRRSAALAIAVLAASVALTAGAAGANGPAWVTVATDFESPLFGLAVGPRHRLLVADAGAGPTAVHGGSTKLIASLPGVTDVAPTGRRSLLALTSEGPGSKQALYRVVRGHPTEVADLLAFEQRVNPAHDVVESNPFDLARLGGGRALVADAAGNSILIVDAHGNVDWVATLPKRPVSTQPLKDAVGCPNGPPDLCGLPPTIDADPVPTTVALGPDGYIYVGELIGFPATPGTSHVWRIDPSARHARCGASSACSEVDTGPFTSIIDINFGPDGTAYVVELDEASWLALEEGQ